jgi:hypothetical protein
MLTCGWYTLKSQVDLKVPNWICACTSCSLFRFDLETSTDVIKDLKYKLDHFSRYSILSPSCDVCGSLKGKLFHATKENTELKQEVAYLTARLDKTNLSDKMIEDDLSHVGESATKSTYKLVSVLRGVRTRVRRVPPSLFLAPTTTRRRKPSNAPKLTTHPIQSHPSTPREM